MHVSHLNLTVMAYTLEVEGIDKHRVLRNCGLTESDLSDEDGAWLPASTFEQLIVAAMEEARDTAFGLIAGKSLALTRFAVMTQLALFSPSPRQLFADIQQYTPLLLEQGEFTLIEQGEPAQVLIHPLFKQGPAGRYRHDFVVTSVVQMLKFVGATHDDLYTIELPYACDPGLRHRYESSWGPNLHFGQKSCQVRFNPALLDRSMPGHDPVAYKAARTRADSALRARRCRLDTAERVRQWLMSAFPTQPSMTEAARQLGLSERTLRRNLAELGTSYQALVQECQYLQACSLLANERMSIKQISHALGFTSPASFHRSFKRWAGVTPTAWRDQPSHS
jgi:AraC-like DNA-binding protein